MFRDRGFLSVLVVLSWAFALSTCAAGEEPKGEEPSCGCGQGAKTPAAATVCVCRLAKVADFGTTWSYWAMVCPIADPYRWGAITDVSGLSYQYSGCSHTNCPGTHCKNVPIAALRNLAKKDCHPCYDFDRTSEHVKNIIKNGVPRVAENWEPIPREVIDEKGNYKLVRSEEAVLATFEGQESVRVKLWQIECIWLKPFEGQKELPPNVTLGVGCQLKENDAKQPPRKEPKKIKIPKDKVDHSVLPADPSGKSRAVTYTHEENGKQQKYLILLEDGVKKP